MATSLKDHRIRSTAQLKILGVLCVVTSFA